MCKIVYSTDRGIRKRIISSTSRYNGQDFALLYSVSGDLAPFALRTNSLSNLEEQEWDGQEEDADQGEYRRTPVDTEVVEHGLDEERESTCGQRTDECVGGNRTSTVASEGVNNVLERCLEDGSEAETDEIDADNGRPRVCNVFRTCPCADMLA